MSTSKHFKKYSSDFKLKVVLKYLSNNFTIAQICSEFNISKATLSNWVKQFRTNSSNVFSDNLISNKATKIKEKQAEKEIENLYKKIGQLTVERDFLKKVLDT
ncbi:MAG: transposase [Flavobacteriia bacterium]|jgi:transposase-like protein|nr:transposase [Flavobacteriia bacterium]